MHYIKALSKVFFFFKCFTLFFFIQVGTDSLEKLLLYNFINIIVRFHVFERSILCTTAAFSWYKYSKNSNVLKYYYKLAIFEYILKCNLFQYH